MAVGGGHGRGGHGHGRGRDADRGRVGHGRRSKQPAAVGIAGLSDDADMGSRQAKPNPRSAVPEELPKPIAFNPRRRGRSSRNRARRTSQREDFACRQSRSDLSTSAGLTDPSVPFKLEKWWLLEQFDAHVNIDPAGSQRRYIWFESAWLKDHTYSTTGWRSDDKFCEGNIHKTIRGSVVELRAAESEYTGRPVCRGMVMGDIKFGDQVGKFVLTQVPPLYVTWMVSEAEPPPPWCGHYALVWGGDSASDYPEWKHQENPYRLRSQQVPRPVDTAGVAEAEDTWCICRRISEPRPAFTELVRCSKPHDGHGPHELPCDWEWRPEHRSDIPNAESAGAAPAERQFCMGPDDAATAGEGERSADVVFTATDFPVMIFPHDDEAPSATHVLRHFHSCLEQITSCWGVQAEPVRRMFFDRLSSPTRLWRFRFKDRSVMGYASHIAATSRHHEDLSFLEELLADSPEEPRAPLPKPEGFARAHCRSHVACVRRGRLCVQRLQAIHVASGAGNTDAVQTLINGRADVGALIMRDERPHYGLLHEAALDGDGDMARFLVKNDADVHQTTGDDLTPLHFAAANTSEGSAEVARYLVWAGADKGAKGKWNDKTCTPLEIALESNFPRKKLYLLTKRTICDILKVARDDPLGASMLIWDSKRHVIDESWRIGLEKEALNKMITWKTIVELLREAPKMAGDVLDALTAEPKLDEADVCSVYYPIPRRVVPHSYCSRHCEYPEKEYLWRKEEDDETPPEWHSRLVYGTSRHPLEGKAHMVPMEMRRLMLPNVINLMLVLELANVQDDSIYANSTVHAILDFVWREIVRCPYTLTFLVRTIELGTLLGLVLVPPVTQLAHRVTWSILCCSSMRDLMQELVQLIAFKRVGRMRWYIDWSNLGDLFSIMILSIMVWRVFLSQEIISDDVTGRYFLCVVCFMRWMQWLYMLRAYNFLSLGINIIPLVRSFFRVRGIFTMTMITFVAFTHSFLALSRDAEEDLSLRLVTDVTRGAWRLLMLGDGDGIDFVLSLDPHGESSFFSHCILFVSSLIFCICILNLFIAVHGTEQDRSTSMAEALFYSHRARICSERMMLAGTLLSAGRMHLPQCLLCWLVVVAGVVWYGILQVDALHPIFASTFLFVAGAYVDRLLAEKVSRKGLDAGLACHAVSCLGCAWTSDVDLSKDEGERYLWWCTWTEETPTSGLGNEGDRMQDIVDANVWVGEQVEGLNDRMGGLGRQIKDLKNEMSSIARAMDREISPRADRVQPSFARDFSRGSRDEAAIWPPPFPPLEVARSAVSALPRLEPLSSSVLRRRAGHAPLQLPPLREELCSRRPRSLPVLPPRAGPAAGFRLAEASGLSWQIMQTSVFEEEYAGTPHGQLTLAADPPSSLLPVAPLPREGHCVAASTTVVTARVAEEAWEALPGRQRLGRPVGMLPADVGMGPGVAPQGQPPPAIASAFACSVLPAPSPQEVLPAPERTTPGHPAEGDRQHGATLLYEELELWE